MLPFFCAPLRARSIARLGALSLAVLLVPIPASLRAADAPLTLDAARRYAAERSRLLVGREAQAAAARDRAAAATRLPDPTLRLGVNNLPVTGEERFSLTQDFMTMRSVGIAQEFTREEKRRARQARFEREADAAGAAQAAAHADLDREVALAWFERHFEEARRALLLRSRDEARLQIEASEALLRSGRGLPADVIMARSSVEQLGDRVAEADQRIAAATNALARWIGPPADGPLAPPPAFDALPFSDEDLSGRLAHHPQLAVMTRQVDVARAQAEIARTERRSDWSLEFMYSQRGAAYSNMISVNVSIPLQWNRKDRQDRELAAELSTVEALRAEREEALRAHEAEVREMLLESGSKRERIKRYDVSLLPLAQDRTRAALASYRAGNGPLGAVLDARRSEIEVQLDRLQLQRDVARLWAQLNYLVPAGHAAAPSNR
ncbi:MAG: TolC family protein [Burkholderiales bacterium]|jgi:outer membrane protein TolC|nr:TolC family protein [Burkholderiales bacterium]